MRYTECDVCNEKLDPDAETLELMIPANWVDPSVDGEALHADVCSWECLRNMTNKLDPQDAPNLVKAKRILDEGPKNNLPGVRIKTMTPSTDY